MKNYIVNFLGIEEGYTAFGLFFFFNIVFVGVVSSYLGVKQVYWGGAISLLLLSFYWWMSGRFLLSFSRFFMILFPLFLLVSFIFFTPGLQLKIVAFKDYLIPSISFLIMLTFFVKCVDFKPLYFQFRLFSIVQLIFVLEQFFISSRSSGGDRALDWDMISGTFGFNPEGGGGNSPTFILFQFLVLALIISKGRVYRFEKIDWVAIMCIFVSVALAEAKVLVVLVIFLFFSVSRVRDYFSPKFVSLSLILIVVTLGAGVLSYQNKSFEGESSGLSTQEYLDKVVNDYFDTEVIDFETGEVSRLDSLRIWVDDVYYGIDQDEMLIGFGLTSSKYSNSSVFEAVSYATFINFASNQLSTYLWDVGVIGTLLALLFLTSLTFSVFTFSGASGELYVAVTGIKFICLSIFIYPIYSSVYHTSSAAHALLVFTFIILNNITVENLKKWK